MNPRARILERSAGVAYWTMLIMAVWILLRGHNAPGGGFIAGLVALSATAQLSIVRGSAAARRYLPAPPDYLAAGGVLLAVTSGLPALCVHAPFLTHLWWSLELGGLSLKLSTVLLFDLGVFTAVWGALAMYVFTLLDEKGDP